MIQDILIRSYSAAMVPAGVASVRSISISISISISSLVLYAVPITINTATSICKLIW